MKKLLLFVCFVLGNFAVLISSFLILTVKTSKQSSAEQSAPLVTLESDKLYLANGAFIPSGSNLQEEVIPGDAGVQLIETFLQKYHSPMAGLGTDIVNAARKYQIPIDILPAIGQCEGNLGKSIPANSHNTWGFGVYGNQITRFSSWQEAIDTVSKAIRRDYFDFGLTTPEKMMAKYTPPSDGSWANCVNKFILDINNPQS